MRASSSKPPELASTEEKARLTQRAEPPRTEVQLTCSWARSKGRIFDVAWSPTDSTRLATAGEEGGLVWSVGEKPTPLLEMVSPEGGSAGNLYMRCAWHPAGQLVLLGNMEGRIDVHSAADGKCKAQLVSPRSHEEVSGLTCLSDDGLLGSAVGDTVQQWDLRRCRRTAWTQLDAHENGITYGGPARNPEGRAYVFSLASRGRMLAAALSDGTCRLLDAQSIKPLHAIDEHAKRGASTFACALSPTAPLLATAGSDGVVLVYDLRQIKRGPLAEVTSGQGEAAHGVAFIQPVAGSMRGRNGGELLVSGGANCALNVTETRTFSTVRSYAHPGESPLLCITGMCAATTRFATGGGSGRSSCSPPRKRPGRGGDDDDGSDNGLGVWTAVAKLVASEESSFSAFLGSPPPQPSLLVSDEREASTATVAASSTARVVRGELAMNGGAAVGDDGGNGAESAERAERGKGGKDVECAEGAKAGGLAAVAVVAGSAAKLPPSSACMPPPPPPPPKM